MKRRELILVVSLELFNQEGEANLSAVDIANELEISPGNLYYHFKGKEEIVAELFLHFEEKLRILLREPIDSQDPLETNWLRFYLILEQIFSYRFFYRNLSDILQKYSSLEKPFHRLIDLKYNFVSTLMEDLVADGVFTERKATSIGAGELANSVVMTMIYWFNYQYLRNQSLSQHDFIQSAILQIMAQVEPYIAESQGQYLDEYHQLYQQKLEQT